MRRVQQIRGSCSPTGMSTMREPPNAVRITTRGGAPGCTSPMTVARRAVGVRPHGREHALAGRRRHRRGERSLAGQVERVEPEQLGGAPHLGPQRQSALVELDAAGRCGRELVENGGEPAAGYVPHRSDLGTGVEHRPH